MTSKVLEVLTAPPELYLYTSTPSELYQMVIKDTAGTREEPVYHLGKHVNI